MVAISSIKGFSVVRLSDLTIFKGETSRKTTYHDVKWTDRGIWAASDDHVIDRFEVIKH